MAAALELITERPLGEVRVADIAERSGMTSGHVLYHFGTRDELLAAALSASEQDTVASFDAAMAKTEVAHERFILWLEEFLPKDRHDANWKLWMDFWLRTVSYDEPPSFNGGLGLRWLNSLLVILQAGSDEGRFTVEDPEAFVNWFHKLLVGLALAILLGWMDRDEALAVARERAARDLDCPELLPYRASEELLASP